MCKHVLGPAMILNYGKPSSAAKYVKIGEKRCHGRLSKATNTSH